MGREEGMRCDGGSGPACTHRPGAPRAPVAPTDREMSVSGIAVPGPVGVGTPWNFFGKGEATHARRHDESRLDLCGGRGTEEITDREHQGPPVEPKADRSAPGRRDLPVLAADSRTAERRDVGETSPGGR